ncbi:MAG: hypothetical protein ACRD9R_08805 [Pyrinomonadaceae bacterium]
MKGKLFHSLLYLTALIFVCGAGAVKTQAQDATRRPKGPIAGPIIKLPRGHYEPPPADADGQQQEEETRPTARQAWEYSAITHVGTRRKTFGTDIVGFASVRYFRGGGEQVEGANEDEALANALTKLGEEGWELVAIRDSFQLSDGNGGSNSSYFFKRPR